MEELLVARFGREELVTARFADRADAEQALLLDERRELARQPVPESVGKLKLDREAKIARIGRYVLSLSDLKAAVRLLGG